MKRKGLITATVLLFLVGLSLLLYPMASNAWNKQRSDRLIRLYEEKLAAAPEADYSAAFDAVDAYNKTLAGRGVPDAFAFIPAEEDALYLSLLNFGGDGLIGYIRIPRISVSLPIYHTTTEAVLARGVGHLQRCSPISTSWRPAITSIFMCSTARLLTRSIRFSRSPRTTPRTSTRWRTRTMSRW